MSNRFYIPRDNSSQSNLLNLAQLGLQLYGLKQQGELSAEHNRLAGEDLSLRKSNALWEQSGGGYDLKTGEVNARAKSADASMLSAENEQQKVRTETAKLGQQFTPFNAANVAGRVKAIGLDKAMAPELEQIRAYGEDPTYTMGSAHDDLVSNWPQKKAELLTRIADDVAGKVAKDPNYPKTPEGRKVEELMDGIYADETGNFISSLVFPGVAEGKELAKANTKAALLTAANERAKNRYIQTDQGLYDTTENKVVPNTGKLITPQVVGPGASLVKDGTATYTNNNRQEESTRPVVVAPGATLVNPRTGDEIFTAPEKAPTSAEQRATARDIADSETKILSNKANSSAEGEVGFFRQYAQKPYTYVWNKTSFLGFDTGGEWSKIELPVIKEKQVTAKDIYDTAQKHGTTYESVLEQILSFGKKK